MSWRVPFLRLLDLGQDVHQRAPELGERMVEQLQALRLAIAPPRPATEDEIDAQVEAAAREVARRTGEDYDRLDPFTQAVLRDTQRAAMTAAGIIPA